MRKVLLKGTKSLPTSYPRIKPIINMPQATATVGGKVIASTDKWETVEGNVYVSLGPSKLDDLF